MIKEYEAQNGMKKYYVGDLQRILGVKAVNIYYWERAGKIPKAKREKMSNYRYWNEEDLKKLKAIIKED